VIIELPTAGGAVDFIQSPSRRSICVQLEEIPHYNTQRKSLLDCPVVLAYACSENGENYFQVGEGKGTRTRRQFSV
jgi:hypothetical protein